MLQKKNYFVVVPRRGRPRVVVAAVLQAQNLRVGTKSPNKIIFLIAEIFFWEIVFFRNHLYSPIDSGSSLTIWTSSPPPRLGTRWSGSII